MLGMILVFGGGFVLGMLCGMALMAALAMGGRADDAMERELQRMDRGNAEARAALGFFVMAALIILAFWMLSGWGLPL